MVLTTSLEDGSFGMSGIVYFNIIVQFFMASLVVACFLISMGNRPKTWVSLTSSARTMLTRRVFRAALKYKVMTVSMAILMFYLLFASVKCAIEAGHQGGAVNQAMVLSVLITVGCEFLDIDCGKGVN